MNDLPNNAEVLTYCPSCGSHDFKPKTEQQFVCSRCRFTLFHNTACAVVGLIVSPDQKLLFTRRAHDPGKGTLDLPGGFVDYRERAEDALSREIKEELSLEVASFQFVCTMPNLYPYKGVLYHTIDLFFICRVKDFSVIKLSDEIKASVMINLDELNIEEIGFESVKNFMKYILGHQSTLRL